MSRPSETSTPDSGHEIRTEIEVALAPEVAFALFTTGIERWWPQDYNLIGGTLAASGVEPEVAGRMWQRNDAGDECVWGEVQVWNPPSEFGFGWRIGPDWSVPTSDAPASRVRVSFIPTDTGTRVELVHDQLEAHGPQWPSLRAAIDGQMGWPKLLADFAGAV